MLKGSFTALITPFKGGEVDKKSYESFVQWQIEQGVHGLVPSGTTGESPTLSHEEHNYVIDLCVKIAAGRVKVIAGTGSNSTSEAIMMTSHAEKVGADGALIATPYYNKPNQEGLFQHFKAIHDATNIPIILYNVPGRSIVDLEDDTILRLAELPKIAGLKDATGDLTRPASLIRRGIKDDFVQLSGEDDTAVEFNELGGQGCISVTSNVAPKLCAQMHEACFAGGYKKAFEIQNQLMPVHDVMFCETSPQPVKYAASLMDICSAEMRLPLIEPSDENKVKIQEALQGAGLV